MQSVNTEKHSYSIIKLDSVLVTDTTITSQTSLFFSFSLLRTMSCTCCQQMNNPTGITRI